MATITRIRKLANPRRRKAVKVKRAVRKRTISRRPKARKAVKRRNPALLVTLGAVNPHKRKVRKVAKRKKRNPVARRRRTRRNPTRIVVVAPKRRSVRRRRSNPTRRRRVSVRRRNPSVFGSRLGSGQTLSMIAGGLLGVFAAKVIPGMLPVSLSANPILRLVTTGGSAWVASLLAGKAFSAPFADAVFFGGLMQTGSVAITTFAPQIGGPLALSGMGDLVPGRFAVPQNPLLVPPPPPPPATSGRLNGVRTGFGRAF